MNQHTNYETNKCFFEYYKSIHWYCFKKQPIWNLACLWCIGYQVAICMLKCTIITAIAQKILKKSILLPPFLHFDYLKIFPLLWRVKILAKMRQFVNIYSILLFTCSLCIEHNLLQLLDSELRIIKEKCSCFVLWRLCIIYLVIVRRIQKSSVRIVVS